LNKRSIPTCVKWTVSGQRGHRGQTVTRTVGDIAGVCVTAHRHRTMVDTATAPTSAPTIARSSSAPVC